MRFEITSDDYILTITQGLPEGIRIWDRARSAADNRAQDRYELVSIRVEQRGGCSVGYDSARQRRHEDDGFIDDTTDRIAFDRVSTALFCDVFSDNHCIP